MTNVVKQNYPAPGGEVIEYPPSLAKRDGYLHLPSNSRLSGERTQSGRPAVFLDRDGVLVEDVHFLTSVNQLILLPGVAAGLRSLQDRFFVVVVTNQSGIARGFLTEEDLLTIHTELVRLLAAEGVTVDALYYCPHLPEAIVPGYGNDCNCRKPGPGMFLRAALDWNFDLPRSFMVGDMPRDADAARAAGITPVLTGGGGQGLSPAVERAAGFLEAAQLILGSEHHPDEAGESSGPGPASTPPQRGG